MKHLTLPCQVIFVEEVLDAVPGTAAHNVTRTRTQHPPWKPGLQKDQAEEEMVAALDEYAKELELFCSSF